MTLAGSDHGPVAMTSALFSADKSGAFFAFARPVFAASASAALRSSSVKVPLSSSFVALDGESCVAPSSGHRVRPPRALPAAVFVRRRVTVAPAPGEAGEGVNGDATTEVDSPGDSSAFPAAPGGKEGSGRARGP